METLAQLCETLPVVDDPQLDSEGVCLWLTWPEGTDPPVLQILEEYGGVSLVRKPNQELWFFFSTHAFLAAARLAIWGRFNQSALLVRSFAARLKVARSGARMVEISPVILAEPPCETTQFQLWAHESILPTAVSVLGLSASGPAVSGDEAKTGWTTLSVDSRLPYQSNLGWYVVMRPVGSTSDKKLLTAWREFYPHIEFILQREKLRYNVQEYDLFFAIEGVRQLKNWLKDYFAALARIQTEMPSVYWPCVSSVIERKGLLFNNELPQRTGVDHTQLTPDYPLMTKRTALTLGTEYVFHEARFMPVRSGPDDWCSVSLSDSGSSDAIRLPNLVPAVALGSLPFCFYCGQRSHEPAACPTRTMGPREEDTWQQIARLDFPAMRESIRKVDELLTATNGGDITSLLQESSTVSSTIKAIYDLIWPVQLRSISMFWRVKDKELLNINPSGKKEMESPAWGILDQFTQQRPEETEQDIAAALSRAPRDYRLLSLRGFLAMEKGNWDKAIHNWKEAEHASPFPAITEWHIFLRARAHECRNNLQEAVLLYDQITRACPAWLFALYRKLVCDVKSGFSGNAVSIVTKIIQRDGNIFNRILIDPELERGKIQIFSALVDALRGMEEKAGEEEAKLRSLLAELPQWLEADHPVAVQLSERINELLEQGKVKNFVTMQSLAKGREEIEKDFDDYLSSETIRLREVFRKNTERLLAIREQVAWFPFSSVITEFNANYDESLASLNWVLNANFGKPEDFKRAQGLESHQTDRVKYLESRMRTLCRVRDATLFILTFVVTFAWVEVVGLILIFVLLPLLLIYGDTFGLDWSSTLLSSHQWQIQKALFMLLSISAVGFAALRTVLRFEKIRDKVLKKAMEAPKKKKEKAGKKARKAQK